MFETIQVLEDRGDRPAGSHDGRRGPGRGDGELAMLEVFHVVVARCSCRC